MDINELKGQLGSISAPEQFNKTGPKSMENSSSFIEKLKKADLKSKVFIRRFYIVYFVIAAFYFALFILNPDPDLKFSAQLNGTLLFLGIFLFAVMGKMKFSRLKKIRYDEPAHIFLEKAIERFKFWNKDMNYALILVVLVNIGSCRSYVTNYPSFESTALNILAFELVFLTAIGTGVFFGHQHWNKHKKPIVQEIQMLLDEAA